ncbi:MAG: AAA family ATPase [Methylobacter sp.]|jgi:wobble nucleotide-excising tRNase|uniref:AAA family ATPase n=1 Tax=Methylobacter sp. TaxID=2051955 RepID=UPI0025E59DEA|nr:AAA family ATPase [Methylobacter sp.]MCK9622304.1 AAA family ATPase [Methylobacter sp.]
MLERISEIQGIGLLHDANGKPHTCRKATLIYGDNGRGKSTLATVLRSLSTGDASLIAHRKTLDGQLSPKVVFQFENGHKVNFDSGAWSEQRPEVLVFDSDFIERNVHSGGAVNTNHRKNLLEFALGEPAVAARTEVEKATAEAKKASEEVQAVVSQLSGFHSGMTLAQFEKLADVADADIQLAALQAQINAAGNINAISAKALPTVVAEPVFDLEEVFAVLSTSLKDVHTDAEQVVKKHLGKLANVAAEGWLSQGLQFSDGKTCPYCDQAISDIDLIKAYQTHFNASYAELKAKVTALQAKITTGTTKTIIDTVAQAVATSAAQAAAWEEHVPTEPIVFDSEPAIQALQELRDLISELVRQKQSSPAEAVGSPDDLAKAKKLWEAVITPLKEANVAIKVAGDLIGAYKGKLATTNTNALQQQVQQIHAVKRRHQQIVVDLIAKLGVARNEAEAAEKVKKTSREKLDTLMVATLSKYEKSINILLTNFGASFSIKGMGANFRGGAPRSEYGLELRGKAVPLEGGPPSFATALSEGDKRTLAFAFFVASTLADAKLPTRTVVIDDPMCSLDVNRKQHTTAVLKRILAGAAQLIVLAHNPYFLRNLRDAFLKTDSATPISLFQLVLAANGYTSFDTLDIDKECESAYFQHHRLLNDFCAGGSFDNIAVAKAVRPMLEGYLHRRFPGLVPKSLLFGQVVNLIRDATSPSPLVHAQNLVIELNEINDYAGQFHHDTNPGGVDTFSIVTPELKTFVTRALHVVHRGEALA